MPEISRFLGIIITMYFNEHNPPHFHARYGEHRAEIAIQTLSIIGGRLPPRVLGLVMEWAAFASRRTNGRLGIGPSANRA